MKIDFYIDKNNFGFSFGNGGILKYDPSLKHFFKKFNDLIKKKSKLMKEGHVEHIISYGEMYILSCQENEIYFYHKDKSVKLWQDDLMSLHRAMDRYLDEQYKKWRLGKTNCGGSFSVPSFYT